MYVLHEEGMRVHAKIYQVPPAKPGETDPVGLIEAGALGQLKNTASLPFAFHYVAFMPDGHQGYGMPIGGVLATENVIIPHAVGVDIGCSMSALKLAIKTEQLTPDIRKAIEVNIRKVVPTGFNHHEKRQNDTDMPSTSYMDMPVVKQQHEAAMRQVGTLGGGNDCLLSMVT